MKNIAIIVGFLLAATIADHYGQHVIATFWACCAAVLPKFDCAHNP